MKRIALLILLAIAVVVGSTTLAYAQSYGPVFVVEYNTDRQGGDVRSGFPVSDIGQCMDACATSSQCRAFTWVDIDSQPPKYNNNQPLCWLKKSVLGKRRNSGMITGAKQ